MAHDGYEGKPASDGDNETQFNPNESDAGNRLDEFESFNEYYARLSRRNIGWDDWDDDTKSKQRKSDRLATFDAIAGQLQLTPYQKKRGRMLAEEITAQSVGSTIEAAMLCLCAVVASKDGRHWRPETTSKFSDSGFDRLVDSFDLKRSRLKNCLKRMVVRVEDVSP